MEPTQRAPGVRRAEIRRILRSRQSVTVGELCALLNASPATIRRDLAALEDNDELERSRGGAVVPLLREAEQNFAQREARDTDEKRIIAEALVPLLVPGSTLFLNDGSTVMSIAKLIVESGLELFIATSAVNVAATLAESPSVTSCLLGGFVRQASLATSGPFAEAMAGQINADVAVLSPDGLHPEQGLTFVNAQDAALARRMAEQSKRVIVVATTSKMMSVLRVSGLPLGKVHQLVVGCPLKDVPPELLQSGLEIISAVEAR